MPNCRCMHGLTNAGRSFTTVVGSNVEGSNTDKKQNAETILLESASYVSSQLPRLYGWTRRTYRLPTKITLVCIQHVFMWRRNYMENVGNTLEKMSLIHKFTMKVRPPDLSARFFLSKLTPSPSHFPCKCWSRISDNTCESMHININIMFGFGSKLIRTERQSFMVMRRYSAPLCACSAHASRTGCIAKTQWGFPVGLSSVA